MANKMSGQVTLSIEDYNRLIFKIRDYENAVKVKEYYQGQPEVEIDPRAFKDVIKEKFSETKFVADYEIKDVTSWYTMDTTHPFEKIEAEEAKNE